MDKLRGYIRQWISDLNFGLVASAIFLICLVSGIFLAVFYDPQQAYVSITSILLYNPWASFWRNLHYWSAQAFLVFFIIHFWGYLKKKNFKILKPGVWFRLSLAVIVVFLVMFTGFLLKGDEDSKQASLIFRNLLDSLPLAGKLLSSSLMGKQDNFLLPYVHHIATTTIILLIIIREHSRRLWTGRKAVLVTLLPLLLLSSFLVPPLHDGIDPVVKGPWYFAGLQELLHYTTMPLLVWVGVAVFTGILFSMRYMPLTLAKVARLVLLVMTVIYGLLTLTGVFFRGEYWQWTWPGTGQNRAHYAWTENVLKDKTRGLVINDSLRGKESCIHCHDRFTGLTGDHAPQKIGCYSCHGGNKFSLDKEVAHQHMRRIPGNLEDAAMSCGTSSCHPDIIPRVNNSLMSRLYGLIAVDRWVFGEVKDPDKGNDLQLTANTPAGTHLKNLCLSCHLGGKKITTGPVHTSSRGGGCLACHLNYDAAARQGHLEYSKYRSAGLFSQFPHPQIDRKVSNDHCFGCHSRSGRISLSYEGWAEVLPSEIVDKKNRQFKEIDGRLMEFVKEDIHQKAGMACIDCHSARDVMGDGIRYIHKEEAVGIRCNDCHLTGEIQTVAVSDLDYETSKLRRLWGIDSSTLFMKQPIGGIAIMGSRVVGDSLSFKGRFNDRLLPLKRQALACTRGKAHDHLHCSACHAGWAPRCVGCHTSFNGSIAGNNLLSGIPTRGSFEEAMAGMSYSLPTLGVRIDGDHRQVIPVIPGMIMTLETEKGKTFHRLFAPLEPHTTQAKGRDCKSCHNDPVAMGFGEGKLEYRALNGKGQWYFTPAYEISKEDGLPMDAWTGFLMERKDPASTRKNVRPISIKEQQMMLQAGACLSCHDDHSEVMKDALEDFAAVQKKASKKCLLP